MSNSNDKQPLDLESLLVSGKAQAPSTTTPTVNKLDYDGIRLVKRSNLVVRGSRDVRPLGISGINQPDVTTRNISHSDEASTSTPINETPYDVDESDDPYIFFLLECAERGERGGKQRSPISICKVSRMLRDDNEFFFTPQLVSIGPIHEQNEELIEFVWLKECYLNDLLHRCHDSTPKKTLEACLKKVNTLIPHIRKSYADMIENYSDDKVAEMMVMDGCFILEFCFKHKEEDLNLPNKMQNLRIAMDLILLENQVPFFVLQALFDCLPRYTGPVTLSQVLDKYLAPYIKLFRSPLPEKNSTTDVDSDLPEKISTIDVVSSDSTYDHVLGYLHKRYQLVAAESSKRIENTAFHSIVELDRSGVNVKPRQEDVWSMTIEVQSSLFACLPWFWKPTLLMPTLVIDDTTELILRNFIAYEQSFPQDRYYFTSYAGAMDLLIRTQEDIAKLVESKVLVNRLGSNQEAADMIKKICKNIFFTEFYYTNEFEIMDEYYNRFWPKNIALLKRDYWTYMSIYYSVIVFFLTVVQTYYTIKGN